RISLSEFLDGRLIYLTKKLKMDKGEKCKN
ncbi:MAG: hypothetical protein ACI9Z3_000898, partial [Roseivirga sp.]